MFEWKLKPKYKNQIQEIESWSKSGKYIQYSTWWKEGGAIICTLTDQQPNVDIDNKDKDGLEPTRLDDGESVVDVNYIDFLGGYRTEWSALSPEVTQEELNEVELAWDEEGFDGLANLGWDHEDTTVRFHGDLILERIGEMTA